MGAPFPRVVLETASNGVRFAAVPLPHLHTATLAVIVRAGSRYETERTNGLSHLLEHMLYRGTPTYPSTAALNHALERLGGTLEGSTSVDFSAYVITLPEERLTAAATIVAEMLAAPILADLDVEKRVIAEELLEETDEEGRDVDVDNVTRRLLFGDHPLGYPIAGRTHGVEALSEADLRAHLARHHTGPNVVVVAAGRVEPARFFADASRAFGALSAGPAVTHRPPDSWPNERLMLVRDSGSQADVRIAFPVGGSRSEDRTALALLSRVLDDGLASRLPRRIIDEKGLAYDVSAALDLYEDVGVIDVGASVAPGKMAGLVGELFDVLGELRRAEVGDDELDRVRTRALFSLDTLADDASATAELVGTRALFGLEPAPTDERHAIERTGAGTLRAAAERAFRPSDARVAVVGKLAPADKREIRAAFDASTGRAVEPTAVRRAGRGGGPRATRRSARSP